MEEILASPKMTEVDLLTNLEKISSSIPNRILKIEGYIFNGNQKEKLDIIFFKVLGSSTTHQIEIDLKKIIGLRFILTKFKLDKAPLKENNSNFLRANSNSVFFLDKKNWI